MQHLDEATIHAWLDGELPFDESSRVTAHAEACDKCTAMIAEARGFLAASSRILRSLDDVPGDVVPSGKTTVTNPDGTSFTPRDFGIVLPVPRHAGARRWIPSRFAAAAAVTVLAVGTYTILNRSESRAAIESRIPVTADAPPRAEVELMDSAAASARNEQLAQGAGATTQRAGAAAPGATMPAATPTPPPAVRRNEPVSPPPATADARAKDAIAPQRAPVLAAAESRAQPPSAKVAAAVANTTADSALKKVEARADIAERDRAQFVVRPESLAGARQATEGKRLAVPPESVIDAERRRLVGEVQAQMRVPGVATTESAANTLGRVATNPTVRTAVGCYDILRGEAAVQADVPSSVRLASTQVRVGNRRLRLAVPQGLEASRDVRWYWSLGGGRILLHKVVGGVVEYEAPIVAVRRPC